MKQERRQFIRQPAVADVRLYHPTLGCVPARIEEWSPAAVRLCAEIGRNNGHDFGEAPFQLGADSMDVLFTMQLVRRSGSGLILQFVEEG
ncbi:hypothetical protein [Thiohalophilus sp.]|uniref:hypothetical protein n=1 Tax=Thiohalophilus sp. TaxID=3028392 RepID=UPI002ACDA643|nr:hypothetical protein [Thiohalophilus sp.]MDZ7660980.1 hypothetical protein [Thiohalophilus sp.]